MQYKACPAIREVILSFAYRSPPCISLKGQIGGHLSKFPALKKFVGCFWYFEFPKTKFDSVNNKNNYDTSAFPEPSPSSTLFLIKHHLETKQKQKPPSLVSTKPEPEPIFQDEQNNKMPRMR